MRHRAPRVKNSLLKKLAMGSFALATVGGVAYTANANGTFALFSAAQDRPTNTFLNGTINLDVQNGDATAYTAWTVTAMAPGDYAYKPIRVANRGSLKFAYSATARATALSAATTPGTGVYTGVTGDNSATHLIGDGTYFANQLQFKTVSSLTDAQCEALTGDGGVTFSGASPVTANAKWTSGAVPADLASVKWLGDKATTAGDRTLEANSSEVLCVRAFLPLTATGQGEGAAATFDLTFDATQTSNNSQFVANNG